MSARPRHRLTLLVVACATTLLMSGCAPTVSLTPAADAGDPRCADVIVHLPESVAGRQKRDTNAQATGAWGDPVAVTLTCGVAPIGPTTKPCVTVSGVDWVLENSPSDTTARYITFGRVPATQVEIRHGANGASDYNVLPDLAAAVSHVPQLKRLTCLDIDDVPQPGTATASPTPTR